MQIPTLQPDTPALRPILRLLLQAVTESDPTVRASFARLASDYIRRTFPDETTADITDSANPDVQQHFPTDTTHVEDPIPLVQPTVHPADTVQPTTALLAQLQESQPPQFQQPTTFPPYYTGATTVDSTDIPILLARILEPQQQAFTSYDIATAANNIPAIHLATTIGYDTDDDIYDIYSIGTSDDEAIMSTASKSTGRSKTTSSCEEPPPTTPAPQPQQQRVTNASSSESSLSDLYDSDNDEPPPNPLECKSCSSESSSSR
jgi:hypothetical protein